MRRVALILALAAILAAGHAPWAPTGLPFAQAIAQPAPVPLPLPGIGPADPRRGIDPEAMPWRAIGRVQTELGGRCTGTLIAPAAVLTAAHCLVAHRTGRPVQPGSVHFLLGHDKGQTVRHARVAAFRIADGFDTAKRGPASADWAVLTLAQPIDLPDRILPIGQAPLRPGEPVALGGYGQDRAEAILADPDCRLDGLARDEAGGIVLVHSCAGTRGTSGAALLRREPGGGWSVIGVQARGRAGAQGGLAAPVAPLGLR